MEFAEGGQVNDREYMKAHGINVNEVTQAVARIAVRRRMLEELVCPIFQEQIDM